MTDVVLFGASAVLTAFGVARLAEWAHRHPLLAIPNERSSHTSPMPLGGGLILVVVAVVGFVLSVLVGSRAWDPTVAAILVTAGTVAAVSWWDDIRGVPIAVRLAVQIVAAAALLLVTVPPQMSLPMVGAIPGLLATGVAFVWLVGFTNAYNFMDGIDGMAGAQGFIVGLAWALAGTLAGEPAVATLGWLLAGASVGFLWHNWSPAQVFMGDVGSTFLGFSFAALPLVVSRSNPALAFSGICVVWPFVFDAAFTWLRRVRHRENVFKAHRSHLYQRLVATGWTHARVTALYCAASVACGLAGLGFAQGSALGSVGVGIMLPGVALGFWRLTVAEERRQSTASPTVTPSRDSGFNPHIRNRYVLVADFFVFAFAAFAAFALRFDWLFVNYRPEFLPFLMVALFVKPILFLAFGLYQRYWRYASVWDLVAVVLATGAAEIVIGMIMAGARLVELVAAFPRSVLPIDWLITMTCAGGVRMSVRVLADSRRGWSRTAPGSPKRVLVIGAGDAGMLVVREIKRNPQLQMKVIGFLDDDPAKLGKRIHGVRVLGGLRSLVGIARAQRIDEAVVALPTAAGTIVRGVIESCREAEIASRAIPGVFELLDGQVSVSRLRGVEIGDLLRRSQIASQSTSADYVTGQVVLVTGAGGSIGSELCQQVAHAQPARLVLLGHGENSIFVGYNNLRERFPAVSFETVIADVRDAHRLQQIFDRVQPAAVFHAAAHKHVPFMEEHPAEAVTNNVFGTLNVVNACLHAGVRRLVCISTDKAVSPTSVMGASKRMAEAIVRDAARRHGRAYVVVRFGNVLGSRGSVVPTFKQQIARGGPIQVTHPDVKRFFMTIPEAVHLVLQAGGLGHGGELFVLNMGEPVRIVDLARDLIRLSGFEMEEIPIVFTGLRPGEKLEEELWESGAIVEETENADVRRVKEVEIGRDDFASALGLLKSAVETGDRLSVVFALSACVPSFRSAADLPSGQTV